MKTSKNRTKDRFNSSLFFQWQILDSWLGKKKLQARFIHPVKGGFRVALQGNIAFLPRSKRKKKTGKGKGTIGQKSYSYIARHGFLEWFRVLKFDENKQNFVLGLK
uniref:Ribosomal protein S1 n=1 Tax=Mesostigma viride TaxID=41882 RepID=Q8W9S3_MESVI|nr:ribosomal protein S1 [Mesostigma viride]AAL36735.1 ribosomal protein S1 [Mesostigma viride]